MPALIQTNTTTSKPLNLAFNTIREATQNNNFESLVLSRHSTRKFLPNPVPYDVLMSALEIARHSPSNSNIQPWRVYIATGSALTRLTTSLTAVASISEPNIPALPTSFAHYRSELGKQIYNEGMGIAREDKEGRRQAVLRNYTFFGAPVGIVVCMAKELGNADSLSVGMFLQTLLLALEQRGLGSCVEVSVAGYEEVCSRELGIDEGLEVLCGVAVGFEDLKFKGNSLRIGRDGVDKTTIWLDE